MCPSIINGHICRALQVLIGLSFTHDYEILGALDMTENSSQGDVLTDGEHLHVLDFLHSFFSLKYKINSGKIAHILMQPFVNSVIFRY